MTGGNLRRGLDRYDVIDRFAVGGAAEIYRARDKDTGDIVVIKRMRDDTDFDPEMSAGFLRECQLAELARHRNLVRGLARGSHEGLDWVALEFVDGQPLDAVITGLNKYGETLPDSLALYIIREALDGLAFAYNLDDQRGRLMGLVHRDFNPRNILVGYKGDVRVCDFGAGLAAFIDPPPTEIVGSLGYFSPEQATLQPLDGRSDLYAAGLILFELVTGKPAFHSKNEDETLRLNRKGTIPKIPHYVDENIALIIEIACAEDREDRYTSAAAMRDAIDRVLSQDSETLTKQLSRLMLDRFEEDYRRTRL